VARQSAKSKLKAEWYLVKSEEAQLDNYLIGTETVPADSPYVVFAFARSDKLMPRGDYQVKLYYNDKYVQSVPFKVLGQAAASTVTLSDVTMCNSIDQLTGKPVTSATIFPSDSAGIFALAKVSGASSATR
jgi:hypothetical protein